MANADSDIRVKRECEVDAGMCCVICRYNGIYSVVANDIARTLKYRETTTLIATSGKGKMIGLCFAYTTDDSRVEVTGFAVRWKHPNPEAVRIALYKFACQEFPNAMMELTVPASMKEFMNEKQYIRRWDIEMYEARRESIKIPSRGTGGYEIIENIGTTDMPRELHYQVEGMKKTIRSQNKFRDSASRFEIYRRFTGGTKNGLELNGYGVLDRNDKKQWIIGPLYAPDLGRIRAILREMLFSIRLETGNHLVILYVANCSRERRELLMEAGFRKTRSEWARFSETDDNDELYDSWGDIIFATDCPTVSLC